MNEKITLLEYSNYKSSDIFRSIFIMSFDLRNKNFSNSENNFSSCLKNLTFNELPFLTYSHNVYK